MKNLGGHVKIEASRRPCRRAFTLVEIMVALSILAFVITAVYASWQAVLRASKAGQAAAREAQFTRIAMRTLTDGLMSAQMFAANMRYYSFMADTSSDFAYLSFVACLPKSFVGSGLFGDLAVRRITFSVEQGADSGYNLVLTQQPLLVETNVNEELGPTVLAKNVSLFQLDFWDERKREWAPEWLPTNQLPKLVRVSLGYGEAGRYRTKTESIETRVVAIPAVVIPPAFQTGRGPGTPGTPGGPPLVPVPPVKPVTK